MSKLGDNEVVTLDLNASGDVIAVKQTINGETFKKTIQAGTKNSEKVISAWTLDS
jgi:hypothetical protein